MDAELRNQTLVAAEVARQEGFEQTYEALLEMVRTIDRSEDETMRIGQSSQPEIIFAHKDIHKFTIY